MTLEAGPQSQQSERCPPGGCLFGWTDYPRPFLLQTATDYRRVLYSLILRAHEKTTRRLKKADTDLPVISCLFVLPEEERAES